MKVKIVTLGCKLNKYESDCMANLLINEGYEITNEDFANIYIINTCAVTGEGEKKSRQYVSKCLKSNPEAKVIVCGCASQNNLDQFVTKENVYSVIGIEGKENVVDLINNMTRTTLKINSKYSGLKNPLVTSTRAYVKIQDGCNNFCSYCIIPYLRGRSRSRSIIECKEEIENLAKYSKEIVVSGIDMSSFEPSLSELIDAIRDVDCRIRLGSLEVNVINDKLLDSLKNLKHFCPQFHLSLQSGSDTVLKRMNRHYTTNEYLSKVQLIRKVFPLANITTDIIVGFCEESDEEFNQTKEFVKQVGFGQVHIFPYSKRTGTVASKMYKDMPLSVKKQRVDDLEIVAKQCKHNYINSLLGHEFEVLTEDDENGFVVGYTENYIKAYLPLNTPKNELVKIRISSEYLDGAMAEIVKNN